MQVYSKKTFDFGGFRIGKDEFGTLPDAVRKTPLFKWALADGSIREVSETKTKAEPKGGTGAGDSK
jgi:hypothetical protein